MVTVLDSATKKSYFLPSSFSLPEILSSQIGLIFKIKIGINPRVIFAKYHGLSLITVFKVYELYLNVIISVTLCTALLIYLSGHYAKCQTYKVYFKSFSTFASIIDILKEISLSATCLKYIGSFFPQFSSN